MTQFSYKNLLVSSLCALSIGANFSAQAAEIKCWTDENGVTTCGDAVPQEQSQEGFQEFSSEGAYVGEVEKAKTPEEMAAEQRLAELKLKEEEERKKQKAKEDRLLELYGSEEDIENARRDSIGTINTKYIERLQKNLADLEASLENTSTADTHKMSAEERTLTERSIEETKQRIGDYQETIEKKNLEIDAENKRFDANLALFREIMERRKQGISE